jgi:peptide/nickel transport system substrate-binding protein
MYPRHKLLGRRGFIGGALGVAAVTALASCNQSRGADDKAKTDLEKKQSTGNLDELMANNPQPVEKLEKGGTLTLSIGSLGPNYNTWANAGFNADTVDLYQAIDAATLWNSEKDGTLVLNKDFCLDAKYDDSGDKPVITYTLNPDAEYNDGTPFDWKVLENQWKMLNGSDPDLDVVSTDGYDRIESVEKGKDDREVIVTMKKAYQPWTDLYAGILHPKVDNKETFNNGFVNEMHSEWTAGPFKLEKLDTTQKRVTMVPNEKWWGDKPVLDKIVYVQMEPEATIPAFKNGEIDQASASTASRYNELKGTENMEIRRSQALSVSGLNFNTKKGNLKDKDVRKAIYQAIDRKAITDLRFSGLNWSEDQPGSWMLMPFNPMYQDNFPVEHDPDAAKKTLEDAGWKADGDAARSKDGESLDISLTNFGDDPTTNAVAQTIQKQLKAVGINAKIDSRGSGDFGKSLEEQSFELIMMGYSVGSDPTGVVNQFFNSKSGSNFTGTGTEEIDAMIPSASEDPDVEKRAKIANEAEDLFQQEYAMMPIWNGPTITAMKKGLANWGPHLYESLNWSIVGWEKGHKQG